MSNTDDAWDRVGSHFKRLGGKFKEYYESRSEEDESGADLKEAFRGLIDAAERVASTVGDTIRDPDVKEEAKRAASSFVDALGATFGEVGTEFRKVFRGERASEEADREVAEAAGDVMPDEEEGKPEDED